MRPKGADQAILEFGLSDAGAVFSDCRRYRYRLERNFAKAGPVAVFLLHNPSAACEVQDDPTSRRGIGFAKAWGCSKLTFVNVWAGIATDPKKLWAMDDPCGPENDAHINQALQAAAATEGLVVAAYGNIRPPRELKQSVRERLYVVHRTLVKCGRPIHVLGCNLDGSPKHPLYVSGRTPLVEWRPSLDSHRNVSLER